MKINNKYTIEYVTLPKKQIKNTFNKLIFVGFINGIILGIFIGIILFY